MESPQTNTTVTTAEIESGFVAQDETGSNPLQSSLIVRGTIPNGGVNGWASRAAHVMGAVIPNVLQPGAVIHWYQHLLTTQSERPNSRATRLADHPASMMPMILPLSNCDSCSYCLQKRHNGLSTSAPTL
ncbi:hypothetical protein TNCV_4682951 [Trichonephila clavipes]|nr:hypothetical protein TNCV_4682951 [Trichonephila clavipes]